MFDIEVVNGRSGFFVEKGDTVHELLIHFRNENLLSMLTDPDEPYANIPEDKILSEYNLSVKHLKWLYEACILQKRLYFNKKEITYQIDSGGEKLLKKIEESADEIFIELS